MEQTVLQQIVILLAVSVVAVTAFRRFSLPPVLAYLFVGVLVGPHGWGWIANSEDTRYIAEFGVVFLLFTVGLEFSLAQLLAMRKEVLGLGGAQVLLTTIIVGLLAWIFGATANAAFIIGGTLALSSTAIVIKQLTEQLELNSRHGRLSVGVLLFQDLAVVPFLIVIPALGHPSENWIGLELGAAFIKGAIVLTAMFAIGHWILRPLFHQITQTRSPELFTLTILLFAISAAWITDQSGLSLALGAFLAGMMLSETEFRHQIELDIRPFRDVLLGLFFITIGMLLDVHTLPSIAHWVVLLVIGLIGLKTALVYVLSQKILGIEQGVALRTGLSLAQGGEFGFALLSLALSDGLLSTQSSQIVLAAIIVSMVLTPTILRYNGLIAKTIFRSTYGGSRQLTQDEIKRALQDISGHVIICGYGRIGQNIARFLERENFDYIALDLDPVRVREARDAGEPVRYGDCTHQEIMEAAGLMNARVVVISYDDVRASQRILTIIRKVRPELPVLVRTRDDANLEQLQKAGATEVVPETLEASLMLSSYLLMLLDVPMKRVVKHVQEVRSSRYDILRKFFHGQDTTGLSDPSSSREGLHSFRLPDSAFAVGKVLADFRLENCHVTITGIRREGKPGPHPAPQVELQGGDVLVMYGTPEDLAHAENLLLSGK